MRPTRPYLDGKEMVKKRHGWEYDVITHIWSLEDELKIPRGRIVKPVVSPEQQGVLGVDQWAMEYIDPICSTWQYLMESPPPSLASSFVQVMEALIICDLAGVIHGDVKPENLVVAKSDKSICLIDFGSACFKSNPWLASELEFTNIFAAPEITSKPEHPVTSAIDMWAVGCCLLFVTHPDLLLRAKEPGGMDALLRLRFGSAFDPMGIDFAGRDKGLSWYEITGETSVFLERWQNAMLLDGLCALEPADRWNAEMAKNWIVEHGFF